MNSVFQKIAFTGAAALALMVGSVAVQKPAQAAGSPKQQFQEMFDLSTGGKKGLMFYVGGQQIGGLVTKVTDDTVEVKNQQYGRVVIRLDRIDAVAAN